MMELSSILSRLLRSLLTGVLFVCIWIVPASGQDLFDNADDADAFLGLEEDEDRISQQDWKKRADRASRLTDKRVRGGELLVLLDTMLRQGDIILLPHDRERFVRALLNSVALKDLKVYVPKLLKLGGDIQFDLSAKGRLNLGIRICMAAGGGSFEQLKTILGRHEKIVDLEWLLPALARAGGPRALPIARRYRNDDAIIRLGNVQNIRRIPCAAVLACAYAGDKKAAEMILEWYEQDFAARPRFAFSVSWAISEGMKPDHALLDYCEHRLQQAERFLAFLGNGFLPELIARANDESSVAAAGYLSRRLGTASADELSLFVPLLKHPSNVIKHRTFTAIMDRGDDALRRDAHATVKQLADSDIGGDRFFAVSMILDIGSPKELAQMEQSMTREHNQAVRRRTKMLLNDRYGAKQ